MESDTGQDVATATIIGRVLTVSPVRETRNNMKVINIGVETVRTFDDSVNRKVQITSKFELPRYGAEADELAENLEIGTPIKIVARLESREYFLKDGDKIVVLSNNKRVPIREVLIVIESVEILDQEPEQPEAAPAHDDAQRGS